MANPLHWSTWFLHLLVCSSLFFLIPPDSNWKSFPVLFSCPAIVWSAFSLTNHSNWKLLLHITETIDGWLSHSLDCDQMTGKRNQPLNTQCKTTPFQEGRNRMKADLWWLVFSDAGHMDRKGWHCEALRFSVRLTLGHRQETYPVWRCEKQDGTFTVWKAMGIKRSYLCCLICSAGWGLWWIALSPLYQSDLRRLGTHLEKY